MNEHSIEILKLIKMMDTRSFLKYKYNVNKESYFVGSKDLIEEEINKKINQDGLIIFKTITCGQDAREDFQR